GRREGDGLEVVGLGGDAHVEGEDGAAGAGGRGEAEGVEEPLGLLGAEVGVHVRECLPVRGGDAGGGGEGGGLAGGGRGEERGREGEEEAGANGHGGERGNLERR